MNDDNNLVEKDLVRDIGIIAKRILLLVNFRYEVIKPVVHAAQLSIQAVAQLEGPFERLPGVRHLLSKLGKRHD